MKTQTLTKGLAMMAILTATTVAQATMLCTVTSESKPGEYSNQLASKVWDTSKTDPLLVHHEGNVMYVAQRNADGAISLGISDGQRGDMVLTKSDEYVVLMSTRIGRAFSCFNLEKAFQKK